MAPLWLEAQPSPPLLLRLYARAGFPPIAFGALLAALYLVAVAAWFTLVTGGNPIPAILPWASSGWTLLLNAAMIGFAPTVMVNALRSVEPDVRDLAPALACDADALERRIVDVARVDPRLLRGIGLLAACLMIAFTWLDPGFWAGRERPSPANPFLLWFAAQQVLLGWLWSRAVVADVSTARAFAALAGEVRQVDLLDLRPLSTFARRGVRSVLYWMVGLALFSLFWLAPYAGESNVVGFALLLGLAAANLWTLLRGARSCIRGEKETQLEAIRAGIRRDQRALLDSPDACGAAAERLPALLAAEARVASVGELAFDAVTALRFAAYVTLGVGSWIGGALIERLLGAALD